MRQIKYIFIDSDCASDNNKSSHNDVLGFRYHFIVNRWSNKRNQNSVGDCRVATEDSKDNYEGLVINTTDIQYPVDLIQGPIYDRDKYNKCSIYIRYCGSIRPEVWLQESSAMEPESNCYTTLCQLAALFQLLVKLRKHFPEAKILGLLEIDGKALQSRNITVSKAMNALRSELSNLP